MVSDFFTRSHYSDENPEFQIPTWIGGWDLRIALFIGLTLWGIHTLSTVMIAYIVGSIVGILLILIAKFSGKSISHEVPFGPFLAIGWIISLSFYQEILDYVQILYT
jgi:prepilin signal peptidase PulO-like enzyme (type II secretory pathway)